MGGTWVGGILEQMLESGIEIPRGGEGWNLGERFWNRY
jgi:hypothetical protein